MWLWLFKFYSVHFKQSTWYWLFTFCSLQFDIEVHIYVIDCKQTWCKKINHKNSSSCFGSLWLTMVYWVHIIEYSSYWVHVCFLWGHRDLCITRVFKCMWYDLQLDLYDFTTLCTHVVPLRFYVYHKLQMHVIPNPIVEFIFVLF